MVDNQEVSHAKKNLKDGLDFQLIIQNCVASVNLYTKINLNQIYQELIDDEFITVKYDQDSFAGVVLKIKDPKVTFLIFSTGKLVIVGAKSSSIIYEAVDKIIVILKTHEVQIEKKPEIIIQNVVASGSLMGKIVNLELASLWLESSMYEPEQFPAVIYKLTQPKAVLLIFHSGNIVCSGAKSENMVHEAVRVVYNQLEEIEAFEEFD